MLNEHPQKKEVRKLIGCMNCNCSIDVYEDFNHTIYCSFCGAAFVDLQTRT